MQLLQLPVLSEEKPLGTAMQVLRTHVVSLHRLKQSKMSSSQKASAVKMGSRICTQTSLL